MLLLQALEALHEPLLVVLVPPVLAQLLLLQLQVLRGCAILLCMPSQGTCLRSKRTNECTLLHVCCCEHV